MTSNNECPEMCSDCGGQCCKDYAGAYDPEDLMPLSVDSLVQLFRTSQYAVDWWEGDPREWCSELGKADFIRPAHKNSGKLRDPSWGGECVHLTPNGCVLPFDLRPRSCRELVPKPDIKGKCVQKVDKQEIAIVWIPYQKIIAEAVSTC